METCGQQEKVASRPSVLLWILEACWIKPFVSGLDHIPILGARTSGMGQGLYKKQMWGGGLANADIGWQRGKAGLKNANISW